MNTELICRLINGKYLFKSASYKIKTIITDTRKFKKKKQNDFSECFIAIKGDLHNGIDYVTSVVGNGCKNVIINKKDYKKRLKAALEDVLTEGLNLIAVEDTVKAYARIAEYRLSHFSGKKIAVTGSCGKTSCKELLAHFLSLNNSVYKNQKNYNNHIGVPLTIMEIDKDYKYFIFEMGMNHAGEIRDLSEIVKPDFSVITNIFPVHIEYFPDIKAIAKAKAEVFEYQDKTGIAYLNKDNIYSSLLATKAKNQGLKNIKYFSALDLSYSIEYSNMNGLNGFVFYKNKKYKSRLFGDYNLSNIAAALLVAGDCGIDPGQALASLKEFDIQERRFILSGKHKNIIDDSYNANPASVQESIKLFINIKTTFNKILVLGDMFELGKLSNTYHKETGSFLNKYKTNLNKVIFIGKAMQNAYNEYSGSKEYFKIAGHSVVYLKENYAKNNLYLFKASNGMHFNKLIEELESQ